MKSLSLIGLAMLIFAAALALCPAAHAWQSGRWTASLRRRDRAAVDTSRRHRVARRSRPRATRVVAGRRDPARPGAPRHPPGDACASRLPQVGAQLSEARLNRRNPQAGAESYRPPRPRRADSQPIARPDADGDRRPIARPRRPTPTPDRRPRPPRRRHPPRHRARAAVDVPSSATKAQIDACVAKAWRRAPARGSSSPPGPSPTPARSSCRTASTCAARASGTRGSPAAAAARGCSARRACSGAATRRSRTCSSARTRPG